MSDKISGSALANPNPYSTPFDFYRIGLDGELELNLNISGIRIIWLVCERERWPTNSTHNGLAG